ncbi:MAG: redoxin domain-containing protein, partial [Chryseobacterium sp.]
MKKLLLLSLILISLGSCKRTSKNSQLHNNIPVVKDSITVEGSILKFDLSRNEKYIQLTVSDFSGEQLVKSFQIDSDGKFRIRVYQPFEGDLYIKYQQTFTKLYGIPGDTLRIEIKGLDTLQSNNDEIQAYGKSANINNNIIRFSEQLKHDQANNQPTKLKSNYTDKEYAENRLTKLADQLKLLEKYVTANPSADKNFYRWAKNDLIYTAAKEIVVAPFFGRKSTSNNIQELKQLIGNIAIENPEAYHNSSYFDFLKYLTFSSQIMINITPAYQTRIRSMGNNPMNVYMAEIDQITSGIAKQLMYLNLYTTANLKSAEAVYDQFSEHITDPVLIAQLKLKRASMISPFKAFNVLDSINSSGASKATKSKLSAIFAANKGNYIFIDFWGDWCSPCMKEILDYSSLIKSLNGKPIRFIFLSASTTEESAINIKNKYGIQGTFINLDENEIAVLQNVLGFNS